MPVRRIKRSECPDESPERNAAVQHRIFLDIRGVIESDELMPDHLRINRERQNSQGSGNRDLGAAEFTGTSGQRLSLLRCLSGHCDL